MGRGRTTAESTAGAIATIRELRLQLGRGRTTAESRTDSSKSVQPWPLQLGRGRTTAESALVLQGFAAALRFNWAAVERPRKGERRAGALREDRRFNWAAVERPRKVAVPVAEQHLVGILASIGPRSNDRGKMLAHRDELALVELQLGRGRTTAESEAGKVWRCGIRVLQLGRGRTTAERFSLSTVLGQGNQASIGPRSNDRGKSRPLVASEGAVWAASIGPRSNDRGKPGGDVSATARSSLQLGRGRTTAESDALSAEDQLRLSASIGPRSNDRGKGVRRVHGGRVRSASIGPRSNDRGKGLRRSATTSPGTRFNWAAVERPRKAP